MEVGLEISTSGVEETKHLKTEAEGRCRSTVSAMDNIVSTIGNNGEIRVEAF